MVSPARSTQSTQSTTDENVFTTSFLDLPAESSDIIELTKLVRSGVRTGNEPFDTEDHLKEVIPKPWGYEYRAYADDFFDFWALHIDAPHATSMHVHPRKLTYLICLGGLGRTNGLEHGAYISAGSVVRIAPGAFHTTHNIGDDPLELIEVEVPRNKYDLMRLRDDYNRAGTGYESEALVDTSDTMFDVPYLPNASMRENTPDGRFGFALRTGTDIFYRRHQSDVFYVPLCLSGVVNSDVEILSGRMDPRHLSIDKIYLCISTND